MRQRPVCELVVGAESVGERFDAWCAGRLVGLLTRNAVKKALKRAEITLDGEVVESSRRVRLGQRVVQLEPQSRAAKPFLLAVEVVFEDEHIAAVHKPAGLRVNGAAFRTLENTLQHNLSRSEVPGALRTPRVAHRLDLPTQGLVLCAKTPEALIGLGRAFQERRVRKTYRALAVGSLPGSGEFDVPVDGRSAHTLWRSLGVTRCLKSPDTHITRLELSPVTGRRHQLRCHLAERGHPIIGDGDYTPADIPLLRGNGLFLAAVRLQLTHPVTEEPLDIETAEPAKFASLIARESRRWNKYHPEDPCSG